MNALEQAWYQDKSWALLLSPLVPVFRSIARIRRLLLQAFNQGRGFSVPVIVVGNIVVGGVGKTPLVIALAKRLKAEGFRPGIVSRGYGGTVDKAVPLQLSSIHGAEEVGDEPRLIADASACPVVVGADRAAAVSFLLASNDCDVVLSDDGLQHYRMHRDIEIAVVDGERGLGNGWCLPAGPLREPKARLSEVDMVVVNGEGYRPEAEFFTMKLVATGLRNLRSGETQAPGNWNGVKQVHGVAGIGNPLRFQRTLEELGFTVTLHAFPDHYNFSGRDLIFEDKLPVFITAKDAVKCGGPMSSEDEPMSADDELLANGNVWVLDVEAQLPEAAWQVLVEQLNQKP